MLASCHWDSLTSHWWWVKSVVKMMKMMSQTWSVSLWCWTCCWNRSVVHTCVPVSSCLPLELHLATSELWFGQELEGILPELLCSYSIAVLQSFEQLTGLVYQIGFISLGPVAGLRLLCVCAILLCRILTACMLYYCNTVRWAWLDWGLSGWLTTLLQCFDTVIRSVKHRIEMT